MRRGRLLRLSLLTLGVAACSRGDAPASAGAHTLDGSTSALPSTSSGASGAAQPTDTATPTRALGSGGLELYPAGQLASVVAGLARARSSGRTIGGHESVHYVQSRRVANGSPEVHDDWVDVTLVQAGRATLLVGGHLAGAALSSPGEHRGGTITGGTPHPLGPGDLLVVPSGIPHQYEINGGDSLIYLTIKVRATASGH